MNKERLELRELKPCPFCGGKAALVIENWCNDMQFDADHDSAVVECMECESHGKTFHCKDARYRKTCNEELDTIRQNAINAWNRRAKGDN